MREPILSVTKDQCKWDYYRGSGKGGQKRNKTSNCCRCTHIASGAVGKSEEGRSQMHNRRKAFRRMAESKVFVDWVRIETSRISGESADIQKKVDREIAINTKVEIMRDGKWEIS